MNLTGLLDNPMFNAGMNILANNKGSALQPLGRGMQDTYVQMQNSRHDQLMEQFRQMQMMEMQRALMAQPERKTVTVDGVPYYMDNQQPVIPGASRRPDDELSKMLTQRDAYPVGSPTWNIYNDRIKKLTTNESSTMVKVADPSSPTGVKYVPSSEAAGQPAYVTKGMQLTTNPDGSVSFSMGGGDAGLTKSTITNAQADYKGAKAILDDLDAIANSYSDDYLTYGGRAKAAVGGLLDKMGFETDTVDFNAERQKFINEVRQTFNTYRKEITGAAASEKEMQLLMDSMMNPDLGPQEFKSAYDQFRAKAIRNLELNAGWAGQDRTGGNDNQIQERQEVDGVSYFKINGKWYQE